MTCGGQSGVVGYKMQSGPAFRLALALLVANGHSSGAVWDHPATPLCTGEDAKTPQHAPVLAQRTARFLRLVCIMSSASSLTNVSCTTARAGKRTAHTRTAAEPAAAAPYNTSAIQHKASEFQRRQWPLVQAVIRRATPSTRPSAYIIWDGRVESGDAARTCCQ